MIMRKIEIDAAHRVPEHGSACRALHGHRYTIEAHCRGQLAAEGEQNGMLLDFKFIKEGLMRFVHDPCDHGMMLRYDDPLLKLLDPKFAEQAMRHIKEGGICWEGTYWNKGLKLCALFYVPTAENLAHHWYDRLKQFVIDRSDNRAALDRIRVWETPNCYADYPSTACHPG